MIRNLAETFISWSIMANFLGRLMMELIKMGGLQ